MAKKKKFQAIKADVGDYKGVRHDGKEYRFRRDDSFILEDEGLAREMDSMYGKKGTQKLAITPYDDTTTREPGHKYTFSGMWTDEAWKRYQRKKKRLAKKSRETNA